MEKKREEKKVEKKIYEKLELTRLQKLTDVTSLGSNGNDILLTACPK